MSLNDLCDPFIDLSTPSIDVNVASIDLSKTFIDLNFTKYQLSPKNFLKRSRWLSFESEPGNTFPLPWFKPYNLPHG